MKNEPQILEIRDRQTWRAWLETHHRSHPGIWLVYFKDHTGVDSITYEDSVNEALCFGWVDSLIRRLDDDRYARKFTPRKPGSKWSDSNRKRWAELKRSGLLSEAGRTAAPTSNAYAPPPPIPDLPSALAKALKANPKARAFFNGLARAERRQFAAWIHLAKRPETREKRLRESIALLASGKKLGLR